MRVAAVWGCVFGAVLVSSVDGLTPCSFDVWVGVDPSGRTPEHQADDLPVCLQHTLLKGVSSFADAVVGSDGVVSGRAGLVLWRVAVSAPGQAVRSAALRRSGGTVDVGGAWYVSAAAVALPCDVAPAGDATSSGPLSFLALASSSLLAQSAAAGAMLPPPGALRPDVLHMTYHTPSAVPARVFDAVAALAPSMRLRLVDDAQASAYLQAHFPAAVNRRFQAMTSGAHRADVYRYAVLYREGGVYLDVKTMLLHDLGALFADRRALYTTLSAVPGTVHTGVLAAPPGHPLFARALDHAVATSNAAVDHEYFVFTRYFHQQLVAWHAQLAGRASARLAPGPHPPHLHLWLEKCYSHCRQPDGFGYCCAIEDAAGAHVFKTRHPDYHTWA